MTQDLLTFLPIYVIMGSIRDNETKGNKMTNFENFIANANQHTDIIVKGTGVKCDWIHVTRPDSVTINGDRVEFFAHRILRWIHTTQKDIKYFKKS